MHVTNVLMYFFLGFLYLYTYMKFLRHIYLIELLLLALAFFQLIYILQKYDFMFSYLSGIFLKNVSMVIQPDRYWVLSCSVVSDSETLWTVAHQAPCPWDSPGKNTRVGCHALFQGIFPTQGLNPHLLRLLHWQVGSLPLVLPGKPHDRYWRLGKRCFNPGFET